MKEIPLTQDQVALVDDEDFDFLNQWKWCAFRQGYTFYALSHIRRPENNKVTSVLMHRLLTNPPPGMVVDHIDGNGLNNTRQNLKVSTYLENSRNINHTRETDFKPDDDEELPQAGQAWTPSELARRLNFSTVYIQILCKKGIIPALKVGTRWRIPEAEALKIIERGLPLPKSSPSGAIELNVPEEKLRLVSPELAGEDEPEQQRSLLSRLLFG